MDKRTIFTRRDKDLFIQIWISRRECQNYVINEWDARHRTEPQLSAAQLSQAHVSFFIVYNRALFLGPRANVLVEIKCLTSNQQLARNQQKW